ncbi:MAG: hypothetical protein JRI75_09155 [Deltaproteobacteria bacterium]|jgi:hypothetical protein|nr:hypothetical protein [Deltaproteobacteria bacterium]
MKLPKKGEAVQPPKIKEICEHYGLHALWAKIEKDPPSNPFKSDGCSMWVDSWDGVSIYSACFLHDLKYWAGYPGEDVDRLIADAELMIDVARLLGSTKIAETMFHGVRIGGHEMFKRSFSWGFGRIA